MAIADNVATGLEQFAAPERRFGVEDRPGPKGLPFLGVAGRLRADPLKYFIETLRDHGDVAWFNVGQDQIVMLSDPRDIKHVLQDNHENYRKSKFYRPLKPILGRGIFLSEGKEWLKQRRTSKPAFAGLRFEHMAEEIVGATGDLLSSWETRGDPHAPVDIAHEMMKLTLDGVTRAMFDLNLKDESDDFHEAIEVVLKETERRVWSVGLIPPAIFVRRQRAYRKALAVVEDVIQRLIERRRREPREGDLLTMLIDAYGGTDRPDHKLLRDQVVSFLVAGHETTAISLAWTWYLLSRNPAVARRFHDEIDSVLGGRAPTFADTRELTYSKMILEEAMRLYPPVWTISREAIADDTSGRVDIPKGTTVMLCAYAVQRHPDIWENPEGFDPDRFAPEAENKTPRHAYFPFGGGPRVCMGNRFSIMEGQLIMAMIGQRYRLDLAPGTRVVPEPMITLRPRGGIPMYLRPRR